MNSVQYGGEGINTIVTSKEAIVAVCRGLAAEQGLAAISMRAVAERCHVAVGSVYNYYPSKAELIAATIQDVWHDIFHAQPNPHSADGFIDYLEWIFSSVRDGAADYPNFFLAHTINVAEEDKGEARQAMQDYFVHMKAGLLQVLAADSRVRATAFSPDFTQPAFVDFVFATLLSLLVKQEGSCAMLCEIVRRTIY